MITNATVEQSEDADIRTFLKSVYLEYDKEFQKTLDRAVTQGELRSTLTKAQSQYLANSLEGLRVLGKINPGKKKVQSIIELTLRTLDQYRP